MKNKKIKKKIKIIKEKLKNFSIYYFNKNKNLISDEKYDFLLKKLEKIEKKYPKLIDKNSPTKKIIYKLNKKFKIKKHNINMLSIKPFYYKEEIYKYIKKIKKKYNINDFCCELKIDGVAISLIYINNNFSKAFTRGNGIYGEDITNNIKYVESIPKKINYKNKIINLEIRGEIYINKKNFIKINKKKKFSNSRNLTSGTIKLLNKKEIKKRKLSFIAYDIIINYSRKIFIKQNISLNKIKELGFNIDKNTKILNNINKIQKYYKYIENKRKKLNFDIDGIVIKINNKYIQKKIGQNNKYIKWAIAWKFKSKKKKTKILKIKYKISKNGTIIPIAKIKPILIDKTKINNVNLYNLNYLNKLNINEKDIIIVERKGDVIPKIIKIIKKKKYSKKLIINKCPFCKKKININEKIPKCYSNLECPEQFKKTIIHFISKKAFNIKNLGKKTISKLIKNKKIKSIIDIFKINKKKLLNIKKIKKKMSYKILKSIYFSKKNIQLNNLIYSLSIPNIGEYTSKILSKKIKNFKEFIYINKNKFRKIKNISNLKKKSILIFLKNNINLLIKLNNILFNK